MKGIIAIFDIDGTLRKEVSPWRHLHSYLGFQEKAAGFYKLFSAGEISYAEWVELDACLWQGISKEEILGSLNTNPFREGAHQLVEWALSVSDDVFGISTGLDILNSMTCKQLGIPLCISNDLLFSQDDLCLGKVKINVAEGGKGPILKKLLIEHGYLDHDLIVFGDGRADIDMFELARVSIAVCPTSNEVSKASTLQVTSEPIDSIIEQISAML